MAIIKQFKDYAIKFLWNGDSVPRELFELSQYFRLNGPIHFEKKFENGEIIAISKNFRFGSIVTSGRNLEELDKNIKDAILTSFEIPSSYAQEASIKRVGCEEKEYVAA